METLFITENYYSLLEWFSLLASIFAIVIAVLYIFRPRYKICFYHEKGRIKLKVENGNRFHKNIIDIKCEITAKKYGSGLVQTLPLRKANVIVLKKGGDHYTFTTRKVIITDRTITVEGKAYDYIRARLLAQNFLGVKKYSEAFIEVSSIPKGKGCKTCSIREYRKIPENPNNI